MILLMCKIMRNRVFVVLFLLAGAFCGTDALAETATFAGGCFWCMDAEFDHVPGVIRVVSGYTGGHTQNPTYEEVSGGATGHFESIEVSFDPAKVGYGKLLDIYWHNVDPTDETGQFCDKGSQYHAGIFYHSEEQKKLAEASLARVKSLFKQEVPTIIRPASVFYPAEEYHQDYHSKNALHYNLYHAGCGRGERLEQLWKDKPATVSP
jgi:methionine-S-sulfoxide reductase